MSESNKFYSHRNYDRDLESDGRAVTDKRYRALMMADQTTRGASIQMKIIAQIIEKIASQPYSEPLGKDDNDHLWGILDLLGILSDDLHQSASAINWAITGSDSTEDLGRRCD